MSPEQSKGELTPQSTAPLSLEELESYNTCRFPALSHAKISHDNDFLSFDMVLARMDEILEFCKNHDISVTGLLQTAWSVILGGYTGSNGVIFITQDPKNVHSTALFEAQLDWTRSLLETAQHISSSEDRNIPLSRDQRQHVLQPGPGHVANTELRFDLDRSNGQADDSEMVETPLVSQGYSIYRSLYRMLTTPLG